MKNYFLSAMLLLCVVSVNAQDENSTTEQNFNELNINGLSLIVGAIDVGYERILNEESAIGISAFLPFDKTVRDEIQYTITPYYRMYFGEKRAAGFFLEGFGMLNSVEPNFFNSNDNYVTDFALGIGIGGKWVTKRGFTVELNFGLGRNLFNTDKSDIDFVARGGITLGYRF